MLSATSQYCRNQAFVANRRHIGLQFHPELDEEDSEQSGKSQPAEPNGQNVQNLEHIVCQGFDLTRPFLWSLLDHLCSLGLGDNE